MKKAIKPILIYFLFQIVLEVLCLPLEKLGWISKTTAITATSIGTFLLITLWLYKVGYLREYKKLFAKTKISTIILVPILVLATMSVQEIIIRYLPELPVIDALSIDFLSSSIVGIIVITIIAPIAEELTFRVGALGELLKRYKPATAIIISSLFFGIFHINPPQILAATISGIVIGYLYYSTRKILPSILYHIINNSIACYALLIHKEKADEIINIDRGIHVDILIALCSIAIIIISLRYIKKNEKLKLIEDEK